MTYSQRQKLMKEHYSNVHAFHVVRISNIDGKIHEYVLRRCKTEEAANKFKRNIEKHLANDKYFIRCEVRKAF